MNTATKIITDYFAVKTIINEEKGNKGIHLDCPATLNFSKTICRQTLLYNYVQ